MTYVLVWAHVSGICPTFHDASRANILAVHAKACCIGRAPRRRYASSFHQTIRTLNRAKCERIFAYQPSLISSNYNTSAFRRLSTILISLPLSFKILPLERNWLLSTYTTCALNTIYFSEPGVRS